MFHVNPQTGEAGKCNAKNGKCPFGGMNVHFTTPEAARAAFEGSMAGEELITMKKDGRSVRGNWADLELYRDAISNSEEVYVHPQGKIAIVSSQGVMRVFKNGNKATTSGTADDLRAGRGSWTLAKASGAPTPTAEDYQAAFANTAGAAAASAVTPKTRKVAPPLSAQAQANVSAGYPATSSLDASKSGVIKFGSDKREFTWRDHGAWNGSAILPVNERANPHKDMKTSEWLTGWNYTDRNGKENVATIEVWRAPGSAPGRFNHKLVATSGDSVDALGSEGGFYHDQSGANMGEKWTLVGAFKPTEGGEAVGEIPDKKMPLYTYK